MEHLREEEEEEEEHAELLRLSVGRDSSALSGSSSAGVTTDPLVARSGEGQAPLGGRRPGPLPLLRGRGFELGLGVVGVAMFLRPQRECDICGVVFPTGPALGGHVTKHRDHRGGGARATDDWVWPVPERVVPAGGEPPVLLQLFV